MEISEKNRDCKDHVDKQSLSKSKETIISPNLALETGKIAIIILKGIHETVPFLKKFY